MPPAGVCDGYRKRDCGAWRGRRRTQPAPRRATDGPAAPSRYSKETFVRYGLRAVPAKDSLLARLGPLRLRRGGGGAGKEKEPHSSSTIRTAQLFYRIRPGSGRAARPGNLNCAVCSTGRPGRQKRCQGMTRDGLLPWLNFWKETGYAYGSCRHLLSSYSTRPAPRIAAHLAA